MSWNHFTGNWKQLTGKVKQQWSKITDAELTAIDGRRDELARLIQHHYGIAREQAEQDADAFADRHGK